MRVVKCDFRNNTGHCNPLHCGRWGDGLQGASFQVDMSWKMDCHPANRQGQPGFQGKEGLSDV